MYVMLLPVESNHDLKTIKTMKIKMLMRNPCCFHPRVQPSQELLYDVSHDMPQTIKT
jgi:hypothetical protein